MNMAIMNESYQILFLKDGGVFRFCRVKLGSDFFLKAYSFLLLLYMIFKAKAAIEILKSASLNFNEELASHLFNLTQLLFFGIICQIACFCDLMRVSDLDTCFKGDIHFCLQNRIQNQQDIMG